MNISSAIEKARLRSLREFVARERELLLHEVNQVKGLMPLIMKQRNGQSWTPADKAELVRRLKGLSYLSRYLIVLALPGGFFILPVLAWWLDRRRRRRHTG